MKIQVLFLLSDPSSKQGESLFVSVHQEKYTFEACEAFPDLYTRMEISVSNPRDQFPGPWVLTIFCSSSADSWTRSRSLLSTTKMRPWVGRQKGRRSNHSCLGHTLLCLLLFVSKPFSSSKLPLRLCRRPGTNWRNPAKDTASAFRQGI